MIVCRKVTKKGDVASRQVYKQRFVDVRECSQMDYKTVTHVGLTFINRSLPPKICILAVDISVSCAVVNILIRNINILL